MKLQQTEEHVQTYYDTSSSTAVEEQQKQFEQLRQMQEDAEFAQKLQEELDAVSGSCDPSNLIINYCYIGR